ncbi:MAG: Holliday junction branch migration protein RuvA [Candidatus Saccharimonadia bacterium]
MIGRITGKITEKLSDSLLIGDGMVEYELFVTLEDWGNAKIGEVSKFYIYEQIGEDKYNLFGFSSVDAKIMFVRLLSVSGVGPKVAMAVLSAATLDRLTQAIASGDSDVLKGVAGIGKKTSERIIVELRGKLSETSMTAAVSGSSVYQALIGLGYSSAQAAEASAKVPDTITSESERIKAALKEMR